MRDGVCAVVGEPREDVPEQLVAALVLDRRLDRCDDGGRGGGGGGGGVSVFNDEHELGETLLRSLSPIPLKKRRETNILQEKSWTTL